MPRWNASAPFVRVQFEARVLGMFKDTLVASRQDPIGDCSFMFHEVHPFDTT